MGKIISFLFIVALSSNASYATAIHKFSSLGKKPLVKKSEPDDSLQYWEKTSVDQLPALIPDGKLSDFQLALERQIDNCHEYLSGHFTKCLGESNLVKLNCDEPVLEKLLFLTKATGNWPDFYQRIRAEFDWYRYKGGENNGSTLFTGYNAPAFEASLTQTEKFRYPLYTRPKDLIDIRKPDGTIDWKKRLPDGTLVTYDDRKMIDVDKSLAGKGLEIAYLEDPLDIMRLQIEGSGILKFADSHGGVKEVGANFAGKNGWLLVSLTKYMQAHGIDRKYWSFSGYKKYFALHPEELWPALVTNPAYTFFSMTGEPPCATAHVYLTDGHTLAADPTHFPLGTVTFLEAERPVEGSDPDAGSTPMKKFSRLAISQDTGGPIKGPHIDIYWGSDEYAALASATMATQGRMFMMKIKGTK